MEITKPAMAGTLESCDCQVTVEPGRGGIDLTLESVVISQYGKAIRQVTMRALENLGVEDVRITIIDRGALDCTLKARIEGAVFRSQEQFEQIPWGGAVRV